VAGFSISVNDFWSLPLASPLLSTGGKGKLRVLYSAEPERGNIIYMCSGPSGPILMFLIHFEFYPTKQSIFEKLFSPVFLEFDLVFYIIFHIILFF
jgi:hypothetical protein